MKIKKLTSVYKEKKKKKRKRSTITTRREEIRVNTIRKRRSRCSQQSQDLRTREETTWLPALTF